MIKKRGSIILESLVSIVIILIIGTIVFGFTINLKRSRLLREEMDFYSRVSYSVENEIKYNTKYDEILPLFNSNNVIKLDLNKDYFNFILNNSLLNLNQGNGIIITKVNSSDKKLLDIKIDIYNLEGKFMTSRNFVKGDF